VKSRLQGGVGDDNGGSGAGRGQKRSRAEHQAERAAEEEREALVKLSDARRKKFKPVMAPLDRFSPISVSLFDELCAWQGISDFRVLNIFVPLQTTFGAHGRLNQHVNDPEMIEELVTGIIEREQESTNSREFVPKLKLIQDICQQYAYDYAGDKKLSSFFNSRRYCLMRSFSYASHLPSRDQRWTVTLPSSDYWEKLATEEIERNTRFRTYLLSKDPTTFQNAVICNSSHGELEVNIEKQSCNVFMIPDSKSVTIISIASPGNVCFQLSKYSAPALEKLLIDKLDNHFFGQPETMDEFFQRHSRDVQTCVGELQNPVDEFTKHLHGTLSAEHKRYMGLYRPILTRSYIPGDQVANHSFDNYKDDPISEVFFIEENHRPDGSLAGKRVVLLRPPFLDKNAYESDMYTTLQNVWGRGIDHITYFDFSCRVFENGEEKREVAEIAAAGEALALAGLAGGAGHRRRRK
jgi:hypothetical protein